MRLLVVSHKRCWRSPAAPSGYAASGGFPLQMSALAELFDATTLALPCALSGDEGGAPLQGHNLSVVPLAMPPGRGLQRKAMLPAWLLLNGPALLRAMRRADAVHAPVPGDVGTLGMLLAFALHKPLFVRHCGDWFRQRTALERFLRSFMERTAGGRNVMLATGAASVSPSAHNPHVRWIFSTSLREREMHACGQPHDPPQPGQARLISVARQERDKGTGVLIAALPLILRDFPGATLDVVGDGGSLRDFAQQAARLGVAERVTFRGRVEHRQVLVLLQTADLFCLPTSASEGFPKAAHEALACGLPVVATRVPALVELLGTGCGELVAAPEADAVADAVRRCQADPARYRALSAQALRTASAYSLERWRDALGAMLQTAWGPLRERPIADRSAWEPEGT